jgi:hypothetical protein
VSTARCIAIGVGLGLLWATAYNLGGDNRIAAYGEAWVRCLDQEERQHVAGNR